VTTPAPNGINTQTPEWSTFWFETANLVPGGYALRVRQFVWQGSTGVRSLGEGDNQAWYMEPPFTSTYNRDQGTDAFSQLRLKSRTFRLFEPSCSAFLQRYGRRKRYGARAGRRASCLHTHYRCIRQSSEPSNSERCIFCPEQPVRVEHGSTSVRRSSQLCHDLKAIIVVL
jgi:hypothetical protein